jgi:hypothetical protein
MIIINRGYTYDIIYMYTYTGYIYIIYSQLKVSLIEVTKRIVGSCRPVT